MDWQKWQGDQLYEACKAKEADGAPTRCMEWRKES